MATVGPITTVRIVKWIDKFDAPAGTGTPTTNSGLIPVRFDTSTGRVIPASGADAAHANFQGIAVIKSGKVGDAVTVVRDGLLDVGDILSSLNIGDPVYLGDTDGQLTDAAGTVSTIVGRVEPAFEGQNTNRLLRVRKGG